MNQQNTEYQLHAFEQYLQMQDRAENTIAGYLSDLRVFTAWYVETTGETFSLASLTPLDIRAYRQYLLQQRRRKASTVNRHLASISTLLSWGMETGQVSHNPAENIQAVNQIALPPKYLGKKEQYALLRAIEKDLQLAHLRYPQRWVTRRRDASMVIFLLNTGLRVQEALDLQDADLEIGDRKGKVTVSQGKGRKQRSVPLNKDARAALMAWLQVKPGGDDNAYIWIAVENEGNGALSQRSVQRVVGRYGQDAEIANLTPHMLRHTFAKNLVDQGVGLEQVATLLGHASLNTTRIYITPSEKDLETAVERLTTGD